MNLSLVLELALSGHPDRVAVTCAGTQLTYADIDRLARGVAARLVADGNRSVVYVGPSSPSLPVALFAAARAAVPFVPLNYRLSVDRLDALIAEHPDSLVIRASDEVEALAADPGAAPEAPTDEDLPAVLLYTSGTTAAP